MRLENKVALITGGSGGIGRETALLFAKEGAKIVVTDVNDAAGQETADEIVANGGTVASLVVKNFESIAIKTAKPVFCSYPHEAPLVFNRCRSTLRRQSIRDRIGFQCEISFIRLRTIAQTYLPVTLAKL